MELAEGGPSLWSESQWGLGTWLGAALPWSQVTACPWVHRALGWRGPAVLPSLPALPATAHQAAHRSEGSALTMTLSWPAW